MTAYSSLGSPARPAKYQVQADAHPLLLADPAITGLATAHGASAAAVALGWAMRRGVALIPKSAHRERIASNLAGTLALAPSLSPGDLAAIDALERGHHYLAAGWRCACPASAWASAPARRECDTCFFAVGATRGSEASPFRSSSTTRRRRCRRLGSARPCCSWPAAAHWSSARRGGTRCRGTRRTRSCAGCLSGACRRYKSVSLRFWSRSNWRGGELQLARGCFFF